MRPSTLHVRHNVLGHYNKTKMCAVNSSSLKRVLLKRVQLGEVRQIVKRVMEVDAAEVAAT